jgi:hypothetical protein
MEWPHLPVALGSCAFSAVGARLLMARQPSRQDEQTGMTIDQEPPMSSEHSHHPSEQPAPPLKPCVAPANRAWPDQFVTFQREITSTDDAELGKIDIALDCWESIADIKASILADFLQRWTLREVLVGDHVATLALAPGEIQTIELRRTSRTLLEESRETASTVEAASEQTETDKEAIHVASTSARSSNWSISGTGGFSISGIGASGSATQAGTISNSLAATVDEVHDSTLRSSSKVTTQSKIQVRGVTEAAVETRQTRILRNPFLDRVLLLNLYEINKRFEVRTMPDGARPMLTAHFHPLDFSDPIFNQEFIASNAPFLDDALLDDELRTALPTIVGSIRQLRSQRELRAKAEQHLNQALDDVEAYLYDNRPGFQPFHHANYQEDIIFDESVQPGIGAFADARDLPNERTASIDAEAVGADAMQLYFVLHASHTLRYNQQSVFRQERQRILSALAATVETLWTTGLDDGARKNLMDRESKTELFRRIPGFLFLWKSLIDKATVPPADDSNTASLADALVQHLRCHDHYYTEQYLRFLWNKLGRTFVVRLINSLLYFVYHGVKAPVDIDSCRPFRNLYRVEEVQRDGLCVLIPLQSAAAQSLGAGPGPGAATLSSALIGLATELAKAAPPAPRVDNVVVPADGLHMEAVAGECVLPLPKSKDQDHDVGQGKGHDQNDGRDKADADG